MKAMITRAATCAWILMLARAAAAGQVSTHAGDNTDPHPGPPGVMPYEMVGRPEPGPSLLDFSDVSGWEVIGHNAEGWLYRTRDERLWSEYSGKLVYVGRGDKPVLDVRLREPVPIPEPWDTINWWNFGNRWGWQPDASTPFLGTAILLRDANGKQFALWPGQIDHAYWFMMCARLTPQQKTEMKRPISFVGFQFSGLTNSEKRAIYLGPCHFIAEKLGPLTFKPWPPETLPFPTRAETILPTNKVQDFRNAVTCDGADFVLSYEGGDTRLEYRYRPETGTLTDITLRHAGGLLRPCSGGGLQLAGPAGAFAPDSPKVKRSLESCEIAEDSVRASWTLEADGVSTGVSYQLSIRQKSLVIEIASTQAVVERIALGRAEPAHDARLFQIPYLTFGNAITAPRVLYADGLFFFTQFDWYVSDASRLVGANETGPGWARYNSGAEYIPRTDGTRNPVRERLFINASPDVQEVLPTIPNPPSPFKEVQGERLWRVKMGGDYASELSEARRLRALGCDKMTIRYHEDTWRDGGESFTFRLNSAPGRGGDEALRRFVSDIKALGWRIGLYTNYTDFAPVNALWNPDHVIRLSNGDWQRAWMRCYAPKPMWAWEMQAEYAPRIAAKFGSDHSYCDVHTTFMPSERTDYDARVPGAATMRRTYECYGRLLYNEKRAYNGPVYSEGPTHWIYAGLVDGNYGQLASPTPWKEPLLVDFDLLKIHPLEMDAGMGAPGMFFRGSPGNLDQFIASTLAYGHIGFADWPTGDGVLKIYNMIQPAQRLYAMEPVRSIAYEADGRMLDTSQAMITGAYLKNRVHVAYENGTEVHVNGSERPWPVRLSMASASGPGGLQRSGALPGELTLPQWGYVVARGGSIICASAEFSGVADGRRIDVSFGNDLRYFDSRGGPATVDGLTVDGAVILKKDGDAWFIIPATKFTQLRVPKALMGFEPHDKIECAALGLDGRQVETPSTLEQSAYIEIAASSSGALRYRVRRVP